MAAVNGKDQHRKRRAEPPLGTRGHISTKSGIGVQRKQPPFSGLKKSRVVSPDENGGKSRVVAGQFDDALEPSLFVSCPVPGLNNLPQQYGPSGGNNPMMFSPRAPRTYISPLWCPNGNVAVNATFPAMPVAFNNAPPCHLQPLLPKGPLPSNGSTNAPEESHNVPQGSSVHATHANRQHQLPANVLRTVGQPSNAGSASTHGSSVDSKATESTLPLRNNQTRAIIQQPCNPAPPGPVLVPLAPDPNQVFPLGISLAPKKALSPVPYATKALFQRALNRANVQIAARNVQNGIPEVKAKTLGIADRDLTYADVLYGRGSWCNAHPGNVFFRSLVDEFRIEYATAAKGTKINVCQKVVHLIRSNQGRFLKKDDKRALWFEVGDLKAVEKTGQALREGMAQLVRTSLVSHAATLIANGNPACASIAPMERENQNINPTSAGEQLKTTGV